MEEWHNKQERTKTSEHHNQLNPTLVSTWLKWNTIDSAHKYTVRGMRITNLYIYINYFFCAPSYILQNTCITN